MEAKDTVMGDKERLSLFDEAGSKGIALSEQGDRLVKAQAEISFKAGVGTEQKRMTKALRELHKQGWTLLNVIEAEDTMG